MSYKRFSQRIGIYVLHFFPLGMFEGLYKVTRLQLSKRSVEEPNIRLPSTVADTQLIDLSSNEQEHQVRAAAERVGKEAPAEISEGSRQHVQRCSCREE
jgi:hypothetical protein